MISRARLLLLVPLWLLGLACQAVSQLANRELPTAVAIEDPTSSSTQSATPLPTDTPIPSLTPSLTAITTDTPTPSPTATRTPRPATRTPTSTPQPVVTPAEWQSDVFEELWQTVKDEYLYPDFNGLDWNAMRLEYQQRIESGLTTPAFYNAMRELIFRLGDDHSTFLSPEDVARQEAEFAGKNDFVGVGILASAVPERKRGVIIIVFTGSPAEEAGLKPHDNILLVDGEPILDEDGFLRDIIRGKEGTSVTLTIQTPGQAARQVTLVRRRITGAVPVPYEILTSPIGKHIGYIMLVTFNDSTIDEQVRAALEEMHAEGPLDGLIIDNRENSGGADTVLRATLSYFTRGTLGHFVSRHRRRLLMVMPTDVKGSLKIPLVVLVGKGSASFGEIFPGILQDIERAYIIGETSDGNVETLSGYSFSDGSLIWLAHEVFQPINHPDADWEKNGIIPDLTVPASWDEFTPATDPAVQAALDYFDLTQ
jgi:carboxyl-terminal processing protease